MLALAVLGLTGCAMALVALVLDWREQRVYALDFGDKPISTTWTSGGFVSLDSEKVAAAVERQMFKEPKV